MKVLLIVAAALGSGCTAMPGSNAQPLAQQDAQARTAFVGRLIGPGPILNSKFGGPIFGWAIDEKGTDGVLTEVTPPSGDPYTSVVETFDQTTAQVTKVIRRQNSGRSGNRELAVDAILANDVGLIDDERDLLRKHIRRDTYYVMAPVSENKITDTWTRPPGRASSFSTLPINKAIPSQSWPPRSSMELSPSHPLSKSS
jgi:hypothetical protein